MADCVDLHIHSNHSDGLQSPREVVDQALALGLEAISITDHDSISGFEEAVEYNRSQELEVVSGVELSAAKTDEDLHILGYLFNAHHARLLETLERFRTIRVERGRKIVARLADLGLVLPYEDVLEAAGHAAVGRPHVAEAMVKNGLVATYNEAFIRYLIVGGPAYVPKAKLTPLEAITLIHEAGGMAVMAHPGLTACDEMIPELVAGGLDGLEIYHPTHDLAMRKKYRHLARKYRLFMTGGSDSHNRKGRFGDIGEENVPYQYLSDMKTAWHLIDGGKNMMESAP